jgi:hypothetical protein
MVPPGTLWTGSKVVLDDREVTATLSLAVDPEWLAGPFRGGNGTILTLAPLFKYFLGLHKVLMYNN